MKRTINLYNKDTTNDPDYIEKNPKEMTQKGIRDKYFQVRGEELYYTAESIFTPRFLTVMKDVLPTPQKFKNMSNHQKNLVVQNIETTFREESKWKSIARKSEHEQAVIDTFFESASKEFVSEFANFYPSKEEGRKKAELKYPSTKVIKFMGGLIKYLIDQNILKVSTDFTLDKVNLGKLCRKIDPKILFVRLVRICMKNAYAANVRRESLEEFTTIHSTVDEKLNPNLRAARGSIVADFYKYFKSVLLYLVLSELSTEGYILQKESDNSLINLANHVEEFLKDKRKELALHKWHEDYVNAVYGVIFILEQTSLIVTSYTVHNKKKNIQTIVYQFSGDLDEIMDFTEHLPRITPPTNAESADQINTFVNGLSEGASNVMASNETLQAVNLAQRKAFTVNQSYVDILEELDTGQTPELTPFPTMLTYAKKVEELKAWNASILISPIISTNVRSTNTFLKNANPIRKREDASAHYNKVSDLCNLTSCHTEAYFFKKELVKQFMSYRSKRQLLLTSFQICDLYKGFPLYYGTNLDYRLRMYPLQYLLSRTSGSLKRILQDLTPTKVTIEGLLNLLEAYYSFTEDELMMRFKKFKQETKFSKKTGKRIIGDFFFANEGHYKGTEFPYFLLLKKEITKIIKSNEIMKTSIWVEIDQNASGLVFMALLYNNKALALATNLLKENGKSNSGDIYTYIREKSTPYLKEHAGDLHDVIEFFSIGKGSRKAHKYALMCYCYNEGSKGRADRWVDMFREQYNRMVTNEEYRFILAFGREYPNLIEECFPNITQQRKLINSAVELLFENEETPITIRTLDGSVITWDYNLQVSAPKTIFNPVSGNHESVRVNQVPLKDEHRKKALKDRFDRHKRSFAPNFIQSIDGAVMRMIVTGVYAKTDYIVNHLHDCVMIHPSHVGALMSTIEDIYTDPSILNMADELVFNVIESNLDTTKQEKLKVIRKEFNELKEDFTITRGVFSPWDIYSFEN